MAKRVRPITLRLKRGEQFVFTAPVDFIVRQLLAELPTPLGAT